MQQASEEWKSADLPRNLQQFGIQQSSEEWKSDDFPRNLQQFGIHGRMEVSRLPQQLTAVWILERKICGTVTIPLPGMSTLTKNLNMKTSIK
jgi:hypothetical protein